MDEEKDKEIFGDDSDYDRFIEAYTKLSYISLAMGIISVVIAIACWIVKLR